MGSVSIWPDDVAEWFTIDSRDFDDSMLEAVHGRVFDRYPGLFQFQVPRIQR